MSISCLSPTSQCSQLRPAIVSVLPVEVTLGKFPDESFPAFWVISSASSPQFTVMYILDCGISVVCVPEDMSISITAVFEASCEIIASNLVRLPLIAYRNSIGCFSPNILAVTVPSKGAPPPTADDLEADEAVDGPVAEFCFDPPHAAPNDVIRESEIMSVVLDSRGIGLMREVEG